MGGLTPVPPPAQAGEHEWTRLLPVWHVVFAVLCALTAVTAVGDDRLTPTGRVVALAGLAVLVVAYLRLGVPALEAEDGAAGLRYVGVAAPVTVGLFGLAPAAGALLAAVFPQVWILLPLRRAVVATVALDVAVTAIALIRTDGRQQAQLGWLVAGAVSLLVAVLFGVWITRVVEQSRQRADLIRELAQARRTVADLDRRAGAAAERERLAADIHDTVAQGLAALVILLEALESRMGSDDPGEVRRLLAQARGTARESLAEARALVGGRDPSDLTGTSLPDALERLTERAWPGSSARVGLQVSGRPHRLPTEHEVTVLRTAQEALTNARRHSGASAVQVRLDYAPGGTVLEVSDDGQGFAPGSGVGFGLTAMRSRAEQAGGTLTVDTRPSEGVTVRLTLPAQRP